MTGGIASLLLLAGITVYFALLIARSQYMMQVTSSTETVQMALDPERTLNLNKDNFDIGIGFFYAGKNKSINASNIEQYFSYVLTTIDYKMITDLKEQEQAGSTYWWNKTRIPLELCSASRFGNQQDTTGNRGLPDDYLCP